LNDSLLDCPSCKNISPFCIVTGMRMLRDDWSYCTFCNFPARRGALLTLAEAGDACPMCDSSLKGVEVPLVTDTSSYLQEYKSLFQAY
jgi:WD repeat-containing protein 19